MFLRLILLFVCGLSFGLLSSAGVFTVLASVGLVPRFAGKLHIAKKVFALEEAVIFGTLFGGFFSVLGEYGQIGTFVLERELFGELTEKVIEVVGTIFLGGSGFFAGMFVGCLAFAIAEMLDSIPIFARRIGFRKGLGIAITAAALGKATGSLLYFIVGIYQSGM